MTGDKLKWALYAVAAAIVGYIVIEFVIKPMRDRIEN